MDRLVRDLTRLTHQGLNFPQLADRAGQVVREHFGADGACWLSLDPATLLPTGHIAQNSMRAEDFPRMGHNEFVEDDVGKFVALHQAPHPAGALRALTCGQPERSPRYTGILCANGVTDELRFVLRVGSICWGAVVLYRRGDLPEFSAAEVERAGQLSSVLADGLRRSVLIRTAEESQHPTAPGVVILSADQRVESLTAPAEHWMAQMVEVGLDGLELPVMMYSLAARARRLVREPNTPLPPARTRVQTVDGRWLTLHGSVLGDPEEGRVAVVIDPAPAPDIAPLVAQAYGLTRRESQLATYVLQGFSTTDIAERLHISPYTVQDHLKSIFGKVGVNSRGELAASLFFTHYVPELTNIFETPAGSRVTWSHHASIPYDPPRHMN